VTKSPEEPTEPAPALVPESEETSAQANSDRNTNLPAFLTPPEAAGVIGFSLDAVYRAMRRGDLKKVRESGPALLTRESVLAFQPRKYTKKDVSAAGTVEGKEK
jgi:hypothetical protein